MLLHEAFHAGAESVLESAAWRSLKTRLRAALVAARTRAFNGEAGSHDRWWAAVLDRLDRDRPPAQHEAEEFAAYAIEDLASAPPGIAEMIRALIGRVKAWALRTFGQQWGSVTPQQLKALAVKALRGWALGTRQTASAEDLSIPVSASVSPDLGRDVRNVLEQPYAPDRPIIIGRAPDLLAALGHSDREIVIPSKEIWDAAGHGLTPAQVTAALSALARPLAVFRSANPAAPNREIFLTPVTVGDQGAVVVLQYDAQSGPGRAHVAVSLHPRRDGSLARWVKSGLLRYIDRKALAAWELSTGLQLPKDAKPPAAGKILTPADVFKTGPKASTGEHVPPLSAAEIALVLSDFPDAFQTPKAKATSVEGAIAEIAPVVRFLGPSEIDPELARDTGADRRLVFRAPQGFLFQVYEDTKAKTVWLDISHSSPGLFGNRIYQAIADSAFNRGWVFKGDPQGLSQTALVRRTENMLSSAIRHGTTDHLEPHEYQLTGDAALGVPPLRWKSGDHLGNIQALIETSVANLRAVWPDIDRYDYDFERGAFRTAEGEPVSDEDVSDWRAIGPDGTPRASSTGTRRGVLLNSLSRRARREGPELFQSLVRLRSQLRGAPLRGIFYSVAPVSLPSAAKLRTSLRDRIRAATTQAMPALLATVPLRPLLTEIARDIPSAREYLRQKQAMDTLRDEWHAT